MIPISTEDFDRIKEVSLVDEMKTAYIDYSMSVIVGRALPDARDGFKPVHRRVLFTMHELGNTNNKPYKKSARIVGDVMGKYHPHGDSAIYDTLVRMAQDWTMRYTLVQGQGNFGNQDGDPPAAMRYTECRLEKLSEFILDDLEQDTVDFQFNFDDSLKEPTVLPTKIPQLLVNGSSGIAVGMATNMLPHNLGEVVDGCIAYIDNPAITIEELMQFIKAPDFPTGGIIFGMEGVKQGFLTGRGRVVVRGVTQIETLKNGREQIVITETPYQVNRDLLTDKIGQLVNDKVIEGVSNVNNESNKREGTRIVIELKKDTISQLIVNQLYKFTELQTSYGINNVALSKGRPKILNLKELIQEFIDFRMEVIVRRLNFQLRKAKERAHILNGYLIALDHLDEVIKLIRNSPNPDEAKHNLMNAGWGLDEIQAKAILELRLQRLTGLERDKIRAEYEELMKLITELEHLLSNEQSRFNLIKKELEHIKESFGDTRKSKIEYLADEMDIKDLIEKEEVVVTISHLGYIKRTSLSDYKLQKRGGRGSIGAKTKQEDYVEKLFIASTHGTMLFFTQKGRCFWLPVYQIPEGDKNTKGRPIQNLIQIPPDDKVKVIIDIDEFDNEEFLQDHFICLCTKKGIIKKTYLENFKNPRVTGIIAITIEEGDELLEARLTDGNYDILLAVKSGKCIRFKEETVRDTGRGAIGVIGIRMDDDDELIGMIAIHQNDASKTILVVSQNGFGKRTSIEEYRLTNRGGVGIKTINVNEKVGHLIGMVEVGIKDDLIITCTSGLTLRTPVNTIRESGRNTQGVKLIKLNEADHIAAISSIEDDFEPSSNNESSIEDNAIETPPEQPLNDDADSNIINETEM
ncbi:MAG: DNA gyrase subunit A [Sediminibacterium sp.]|nr:DNA gyrase subunit A [Sediminibacterium sp.]